MSAQNLARFVMATVCRRALLLLLPFLSGSLNLASAQTPPPLRAHRRAYRARTLLEVERARRAARPSTSTGSPGICRWDCCFKKTRMG